MNQTNSPARVGAVIMAAGAGRRMGNVPKSLLRRDGEPLLLRQLHLAAHAGATSIAVVLGHHAGRLASVLDAALAATPSRYAGTQVRAAVNPAPDDGTASSLRYGLAALPRPPATCLVLLGDQPLLEAEDVQAVLAAWHARPAGIELVVPRHGDQPGHPVAFGHEVCAAVARGQGVRAWRLAHPEHVSFLPADHARFTTDIDTPADLTRLHHEFGVQLTWPERCMSPVGAAPGRDPRV